MPCVVGNVSRVLRRTGARPFQLPVVCLLLVALAACSREAPQVHAPYPANYIPLPVGRDLQAVDMAIAPDRTLHCVASITYGPKGSARGTSLYYVRGIPRTGGWEWVPAQMLLKASATNARVLVAGNKLHILTGLFLRHYLSDDNGATWRDVGDLVDSDSASARIFDVVSVGDTLLVAYISWIRATSGGFRIDDSRTMLHLLRWSPRGDKADHVLAGYPVASRSTPGPRLSKAGETIHLVAGIRAEPSEWSERTGVALPRRGSIMQFDYHRSDDAGRSWTRLDPLPLSKEWYLGKYGTVGDVGFGTPDLALAADSSGASALWGLMALHLHRLRPPGDWEAAQEVDSHPVLEPDPDLGFSSIQATATRAGTVAAWISLAHAHGEPLMERPPSNDVYLATRFHSGREFTPQRITDGSTYTRTLRMHVLGDSLYILRGGFDTGGPNRTGYNPRKVLSFMCVPLRSTFPGGSSSR
jgi:hypothetical protein